MSELDDGGLRDRAARLATLAASFSWHTHLHPTDPASLARARARTARECDDDRRSPLAPESAIVVARRAARGLDTGARVVVVDSSRALTGALADMGFAVVALVEPDARGAHVDDAVREERAFDVRAPVDGDLLSSADLVVVDTFRREGTIIPLLCRALAMTKPGGAVSLLSHALLRDHLRTLLDVIGVSVRARDDEIAARLFAGARPADIYWDHVVVERAPDTGPLPVAGESALSPRALFDHDAELSRHGCVEVHGIAPPYEADAPARVVDALAKREGRAVQHLATHTIGDRRAFHAVLDDATALTGHHDVARRVLRVDLTRWTPTRHADLVAAIVETFSLDDAPLRFLPRA